jgi:hypothetical protein
MAVVIGSTRWPRRVSTPAGETWLFERPNVVPRRLRRAAAWPASGARPVITSIDLTA